MKIFIVGHKNPDLDTIASAVTYAEFLKKFKRYEGVDIIPTIPGSPNKETQFVFEKLEIPIPKTLDEYQVDTTDAFVLVDHNEESQRHEKVVTEQIIEIVDHHKINLNFTTPIRIDVRPLGSTSTVIYKLFDMYGIKPSEKTKQLILAAIISDTQGLKAKTTTGYDSKFAHDIATKSGIKLDDFIFDIFKAKSDIKGLTIEEIATKDYKVFDFAGNNVFINQIETVEPQKILDKKTELIATLDELKAKHGAGQAYIVITDILKINSQVLYATEEEKRVLEEAFMAEGTEGTIDIGPRLSRKKDIAPAIETVLKKTA